MPFDSVGMRSARSSTSEAGVFLRRLRCERRVEAAWRLSQRLPDWRAQRSIAARMISMRGRCRKGRFVAPAAGVVQSVTRIQALSPRSRAWSNLRPWAIPCGLCFGGSFEQFVGRNTDASPRCGFAESSDGYLNKEMDWLRMQVRYSRGRR